MKDFFVFLKAIAVFLGTVIGVGIFGLPFVAAKSGFPIAFVYLGLAALFVILIQRFYSEVVLGTDKIHRLPGYVAEYLSPIWGKLVFLVISLGCVGSLIAYLIIGGQFLFAIFSPFFGGAPALYSVIFFLPAAYLVFKGIKSIAEVELFLSFVFISILVLFLVLSLPFMKVGNFKTIHFDNLTLPYGVMLYALWGSSIIPEIKEYFSLSCNKKQVKSKLRKTLFFGLIFCSLFYLLFIVAVFGACGFSTTEDAISGMQAVLGSSATNLGFIFGVVACFTSFLALGLTLKKVLWYDFNVPKNMAWAATCFFPLCLFALGLRRFIDIIGFTGAVALGLEGIIIIFLYKEFLKDKLKKKMNSAIYLLALVFVLGIVFEIVKLF